MARKLIVEIVGDASSFSKSLKTAEKSTQGFAKKSMGIGSSLAKAGIFAGAAAGVGALGAAVKTGISEFTDAQKVAAQTRAVLKSTGGVAGVTAGHIEKLAGKIQNYSGIDDEAIQSGENLLATFKDVRNETGRGNKVFDQATTVMADMSTALGQDMKTSAIQLGKALNDPVKGVGNLRRVGVNLTTDQTKLIKKLVATGNTMGAQKIILKELRSEFGNSAKAAGQTLSGKLNLLKGTFENLAGQITGMVMPAFKKLVDRAVAWITNVRNQRKVMDTAREVYKTVVKVMKTLKGLFDGLSTAVGGSKHAIELLIGVFVIFKGMKLAGTVAGIAQQFGLMSTNAGKATTSMKNMTNLKGLVGKAGLAGAVGLLSYNLSKAVFHATGLDKKFEALGGKAYDLAANIGLVNDPMKQFAGKVVPTQAITQQIRAQVQPLIGKMTATQAVAKVAATHPGMAGHDIDVLVRAFMRPRAAAAAGGPHISINGDVHVQAQNPRDLQDALTKAHRGRPVRRRGDP